MSEENKTTLITGAGPMGTTEKQEYANLMGSIGGPEEGNKALMDAIITGEETSDTGEEINASVILKNGEFLAVVKHDSHNLEKLRSQLDPQQGGGKKIEILSWTEAIERGLELPMPKNYEKMDERQLNRAIDSMVMEEAQNKTKFPNFPGEFLGTHKDQMLTPMNSVFASDGSMKGYTGSVEPTHIRGGKKIGRNDPCVCGSGKKHKKCCLNKHKK